MKHINNKEDLIRKYQTTFRAHIQRTIPLTEVEFEHVISFFTIKFLRKKDFLLMPGQVCRYETYIVEGLFQTSIMDDLGKQHTLYFPHEDWWVGDFKSFKKEQKSYMEIISLEDAVLLQISKLSLEELFRSFPRFERFFRILNENAGIALQDRLVQHYSTNAEEKFREFKAKYPSLLQRLSNKMIASYLGVTPEYFSHILKKA